MKERVMAVQFYNGIPIDQLEWVMPDDSEYSVTTFDHDDGTERVVCLSLTNPDGTEQDVKDNEVLVNDKGKLSVWDYKKFQREYESEFPNKP